ncbi:MAG: chromosome segregation SMC family protein [Candidatus Saccharibacteria bacterium]
MYLKRLEIHGFKSFAHKTVLDFEPGMTAVVGPNGSGKSNVADSLRWVMGEQSMKLLRGKKSEDVIFAGSDKKSKLSMAEVALTFDNKDRKLPFDYAEVEIRRRVYRNGESEYLINNQRARLLDVVDALMRSGFGATNYAVIGQGTIDQMILAGPAEIKNLIEEASGVKPYYLKREKTIRRLQQTEENLVQVSQLINEIEPRLRSLKRQAKRMEEREAISLELKQLQNRYYSEQYRLLNLELSAVNDGASLKQKTIGEVEAEISQFQKVLEKEEQENRKAANFSYELNKTVGLLEQKRFKLQEDLAEIRGKLKADMIPGSIDRDSLNVQKLDLERELESSENRQKGLVTRLTNDEKQLARLQEQLEKLGAQIERAKNNKIDLTVWQQELKRFELNFLETLDRLRADNLEEGKNRLKAIVTALSTSNAVSASSEEDLGKLMAGKEQLVAEVHQLELRVVEQKTLKGAYQEEIESLTMKLNQVKSLLKDNPQNFKSELFRQEEILNADLNRILSQIEESKAALSKVEGEERSKKSFLVEEEKKYRRQSAQVGSLKDELNKLLVEKARLETRLEGLLKEVADNGLDAGAVKNQPGAELEPDIVNRIEKLKHQLELAGGIDEGTLAEYRETEERFAYLTSQSGDLTKAVSDLKQVIEELDVIIKKQFDEAFERISSRFSEYFRILFNGGRAHMALLKEVVAEAEEEDDDGEDGERLPEETEGRKGEKQITGIEIKATPPGKKLSTIASLSGGERALTAIALLCSMLASYPSPFVVLDEVDAALDEANSIRFAKILSTLAHQTQFVTITHNRETMRQAHTLYGVTMSDEGVSKMLSLKLDQAIKAQPPKVV